MLVVIQALDAGGKDGTIRHVLTGVNPAGVAVNGIDSLSAWRASYCWQALELS